MLNIRGLKTLFLGPVDLAVPGGQAVAIMGSSGTGKSIFLRAIADLDLNEGEILLDGEDRDAIPAPLWRRRVAYVAAESGWWSDNAGHHFEDKPAAARVLREIGLSEMVFDWSVARLSTGEKQRLSLCRTLAMRPRVLLLDEPTSSLDEENRNHVEALLKKVLADGVTIIFSTHDRKQATRLGASIHRIENGLLIQEEAA